MRTRQVQRCATLTREGSLWTAGTTVLAAECHAARKVEGNKQIQRGSCRCWKVKSRLGAHLAAEGHLGRVDRRANHKPKGRAPREGRQRPTPDHQVGHREAKLLVGPRLFRHAWGAFITACLTPP